MVQVLHIIVLWPTILIAVKYGFEVLYVARSLVRFELILVNLCIMGIFVKISVGKMFINIMPSCVAALAMWLISIPVIQLGDSVIWEVFSMLICVITYLVIIWFFPQERSVLKQFLSKNIIKDGK